MIWRIHYYWDGLVDAFFHTAANTIDAILNFVLPHREPEIPDPYDDIGTGEDYVWPPQ